MGIFFSIREGDWGVDPLTVQVTYADGSSIPPIPVGAGVVWTMVHRTSSHRVTGAGVISGTNRDTLSWTPASGDTAKSGMYDGAFKVTYPGGQVLTVPTCSSPAETIVVEVCRKL